ncbi:MAG: hypothetical protein IKZ88_00555 [Neisseriaceae bacterium]|nr:hypothetical protein [Neisseriaceae bacterium]
MAFSGCLKLYSAVNIAFCRYGGLKTHPTALLYLCRVGLLTHRKTAGFVIGWACQLTITDEIFFRQPETIYSAVNIVFCRYGGLESPPYGVSAHHFVRSAWARMPTLQPNRRFRWVEKPPYHDTTSLQFSNTYADLLI